MAKSQHTPSRRAVLGALAASPAIGGFAATLAGIGTAEAATPDRAKWYRMKAEFERLEAAEIAFARDVYHPVHEAWQEAVKAIPHETITVAPGRTYTTACPHDLRSAKTIVELADRKTGDRAETDYSRACRELLAAQERREAEMRRLAVELRVDEYGDEDDRIGNLRYNAEWALMEAPAPDRPALLWKLENLFEVENGSTAGWSESAVAQTLADMRRLLGDA